MKYYRNKFVNINGCEHSKDLDTWKEVEVCLLEAIEERTA